MLENHTLPDLNQHKPANTRKKRLSSLKIFLSLLFLALAAGLATTGYLYYQTRQQLQHLSTVQGQQELARKEVQQVVAELGKLTILPSEEPVIATILDEQFLATQSAFYKDAKQGDKIVIYREAQKAFIYSPSRNIIVNSGPLILDQTGNGSQMAQPVNIEIRNGSTTTGAGSRLSTELQNEGFAVTKVGTASSRAYSRNLVFANNANIRPEELRNFATKINAEVASTLPEGERTTQADILVIVGNQ